MSIMKKPLFLLFIAGLFAFSNITLAQIVGTNCFIQGQLLEAGFQRNGSMGAPNAPSSYHPHSGASMCGSSTRTLASVYDFGYDGWGTGTPVYMGDYTLPGSPWEEWDIEVNGSRGIASSNTCSFTGSGGLAGSFSGWATAGGTQTAYWAGTFMSGGLTVTKEHHIDTLGSALMVSVKLVNTTSSAMTDVYYMRTCDPDNPQSWGGSFSTRNQIVYQNDYYHRVQVTATATGSASTTGTPPCPLSLSTKDCRAKALIFTSWPLSSASGSHLAAIWAGSSSYLGTSYYTQGAVVTNDIAIGLVFNLGTIAAGDSVNFCYAYVYNNAVVGIDSAFPEPQLNVGGTITDSLDTVIFCDNAPTYLPLDILHGSDPSCNCYGSGWTWAPATGLSATTGTSVVLDESAVTSTITYTVTGNAAGGGSCRTKQFLVTVTPVSTSPPTTRDTTYCLGIIAPSITYNVTIASGTLVWYTTATGGTGSTIPPTIITSAVGTYTYYVSQTSPGTGCESARVPITITIAAAPAVTLTNYGPYCPGDNLFILLVDAVSASGTTYSWTGPGGFTSTTHDITINPCVYADSGVYTVVANNNGCLTLPTSTTVVVHSTPPSPVFTNPTYCQYVTASPLSATGTSVLWYTTATGGVGSTIAPTPSTAAPGTFTFYVTQTVNGCTSARYPVIVTVNPKPAPPVIWNSPGEYCPNAPFMPFSIGAGTGSVLWYTNPTGGTGSATAPTISSAVPGSFTVYASQTILGCEGDRTPITILVYDSVKAHFTPTLLLGCTEDTVIFNNSSYGAVNYLWDFGDGISSSATNPLHIYPVQSVYIVKLFAHSLHCVDSLIKVVDTRHPLHAHFNYAPAIVCQGLPVAFTDSSVATSPTYRWLFDDGTSSSAINPNHSFIYTGTYHIKEIVTDLVPCVDTAYGTVVVDSLSPLYMSLSDSAFCRGTYITLSADFSHLGNTYWAWDFGNGDSTLDVNPVVYSYPGIGTYTVTATAYFRVCPPAVATHTVTVVNVPTIDLGPDTAVCSGSAAITIADYINAGTSGAHWLWNTGQTTSAISVTSAGYYAVTVTIHGCSATDSVEVRNDCHIHLPTCFSPNRDGVNDYFNPRDFFDRGLKTFSMRIYNRWGQTVFEANSTEGRGWDGMFNGVLQPEGVYIYTVNATFIDGENFNKTGNLTLIK